MAQPTVLIVCPTSHLDWDWRQSFDIYYKTYPDANPGQSAVQEILESAFSLMQQQDTFIYNLAELAWLRRYLIDNNGQVPQVSNLAASLCLMGGAMTSPDNLVCDGEVFVRTYLIGRQWARSVGLGGNIANVAWLPDDFGHDPELPVILTAMGLEAVGFARVPGSFPTYYQPLDGTPSLACQLIAQGLVFYWQASDTSTVLAHFMPDTYAVPPYPGSPNDNATAWLEFVKSSYLQPQTTGYQCSGVSEAVWPGGIAFAPAGSDFALPTSTWVQGVDEFNQNGSGTEANIGTFADFIAAVQTSGATLNQLSIDPSNFLTGFFGSRPALKTLQARASSNLISAEFVSSLLRLGSPASSAALDALDSAIAQVWNILAPSSHHDFCTGTSVDAVYKDEQYPMMSLAAKMADGIYENALRMLADMIPPSDGDGIVLIHNPVGVARGGIVELDRGVSVSFEGSEDAVTQPLSNGGLLVQSPEVPSLGYISGSVKYTGQGSTPPPPVVSDDEITLDNGIVKFTIQGGARWAITSIELNGAAVLSASQHANFLEVYDDNGNLYQYGNELINDDGVFTRKQVDYFAGKAVQTEFGPLRWRVEAEVKKLNGIRYILGYTLLAGEPIIRMDVTGSAASGTTVLTKFPVIATDGVTQATHLIYGTAHHYHEDAVPAYWEGPTFKATHHFLMPAADDPSAAFALAAIYHNGMPAWACESGKLFGSLFRNTPGTQRGASGTDSDTHTQQYALHLSMTPLDPSQAQPLIEALQVTMPLRAVLATPANTAESPVTMPPSGSLASTPSPALVRVVRPMGEVANGAGNAPQGAVALRIYRPDANGTSTPVQVTMPILSQATGVSARLVTALEEDIPNAPAVGVQGDQLTVPTNFAVTTVAVTVTRPEITESN